MSAAPALTSVPRYRFGDFILSPRRRVLLHLGREQPLIPRYFDLLVFLVERRGEAVHRREIFDRVWSDVVVSDSALSQAIRTIRRALQDDSRDPRFVRTVSRHGYRFVFPDVVEEDDEHEAAWPEAAGPPEPDTPPPDPTDPFDALLDRVARAAPTPPQEEDQREAAELLHGLGTAEALRRLGTRPHHAFARALLRDTRWDVAGAGDVPILGSPAPFATARALVQIRLRRMAAGPARWASAAAGGGLAGALGGALGGLLLAALPGTSASLAVVPVLALVGGGCGAAGGAGVGAGLSLAESIFRSRRVAALAAGAALGGSLAGAAAQWLSRWSLAALVGVDLATGGALEGIAIGGAAGLGFGLATRHLNGGLAAPRGRRRVVAAAVTAAACGVAALGLAAAGHPLVGGTVHLIAQTSGGGQTTLTPLARLVGEPEFGPITAAAVAAAEGALFGAGLAVGLTRRRHGSTRSHEPLTPR